MVIDGYGKYVGTVGRRILVKAKGRAVFQSPACRIARVVVPGNGTISFQAIRALSEASASLLITDRRGRLAAVLEAPQAGTAALRRNQYQAALDGRGTHIATQLILAKMRNQSALLRSYGRQRRGEVSGRLQRYAHEISNGLDELADLSSSGSPLRGERMMGFEGRASRDYWKGVASIVPSEYKFSGRTGRGATDVVNAMLNYGYAILMGEVWRCVNLTPLDPYAGFLHADRPGRPSLILDLMEQFRQQLVDRVVINLAVRRRVRPKLAPTDSGLFLDDSSKKTVTEGILDRLQLTFSFGGGRKTSWARLVEEQTNSLSMFLLGKRAAYEGLWLRW